jgi:uncharacterized small protein (DUF1192 family)
MSGEEVVVGTSETKCSAVMSLATEAIMLAGVIGVVGDLQKLVAALQAEIKVLTAHNNKQSTPLNVCECGSVDTTVHCNTCNLSYRVI